MLKASVIGNLGNDPELKYSGNGAPFLRSVCGVGHQSSTGIARRRGSTSLSLKGAESNSLSVSLDLRSPDAITRRPIHAAECRCSSAAADVLAIEAFVKNAEVVAATVKTVAVDVVRIKSVAADKPENRPVKQDDAAASSVAAGVAATVEAPTPSRDMFSVRGINECVSTDRAVACTEWNTHGILGLHRGNLPLSRPRTVSAVAGVFACLNYTRLEGEACA